MKATQEKRKEEKIKINYFCFNSYKLMVWEIAMENN